jgi:hypothetical protein
MVGDATISFCSYSQDLKRSHYIMTYTPSTKVCGFRKLGIPFNRTSRSDIHFILCDATARRARKEWMIIAFMIVISQSRDESPSRK